MFVLSIFEYVHSGAKYGQTTDVRDLSSLNCVNKAKPFFAENALQIID